MRYKFKNILLPLLLLFAATLVRAQYPGGVSTGTVRGYKVDYYNGTFTTVSQFGAGTANAIPGNTAYTNKITNNEFNPIDNTYYGLEYTGTLEIGIAGNYTFTLGNVDDRAWLYIDGTLLAQAVYGSSAGTQTVGINLTAGNHTIKVKTYNGGGSGGTSLKVSNGPAGSGITTATDVDGRFVRYDNAKIVGWYKATDLSFTPNYYGTNNDKANAFINKVPGASGNGDLNYSGSGGAARDNKTNLVNFNPGVTFDGDDGFKSGSSIKGLSLRGATKTMFMVNDYLSNQAQSGIWMFYHGDTPSNQRIGFYKLNATGNQLAVNSAGVTDLSAYTANEPKLLGGVLGQELGAAAPANTNPATLYSNGSMGTTAQLFSNADVDAAGLQLGGMNKALVPEAIYYPFALSDTERRKVNTYLAVKYGISLSHDYINTSGSTVFSLTSNAGYTNRIFGLGREVAVEGLNQKQSQSQMAGTGNGYNFLTISKGAVAVSNADNTGALVDGDYLLLGDNNGSLSGQIGEIPASFSSLCTANRMGREWKVQRTGNPGAVTIQAGTASFPFAGNAAGINLLIDTDGDGDFTTGTVTAYPASSFSGGIATFNNISLATGDVITFAWTAAAPGGVSNGLKLWTKADDPTLPYGVFAKWNDLSPNANHLLRTNAYNADFDYLYTRKEITNHVNYNPSVNVTASVGSLSSSFPLAMNGDNTYAEFYMLKFINYSVFNSERIILPCNNPSLLHWGYASGTKLRPFGNGTAQSDGTGPVTQKQLALYNGTHSGIAALLRVNGQTVFTRNTTEALTTDNTRPFVLTSDDGNYITQELIVYDAALTETEIAKITSYLSLKYSFPYNNGASNYLSSSGTTIWPVNATYKNDIFGIGRDDCSSLEQKQSTAWQESTTNNLIIALGSLAKSNEGNTNNFSANNQFLVVGHDGGPLSPVYSGIPSSYASACTVARYGRTWKASNTGNVTGVQLIFGNSALPIKSNWVNVQLAIDNDGDGNFNTGTVTLIPASSTTGGKTTINNVTLPDGAVFTLVFTIGYPGGVITPSSGISITTPSGTTSDNINGLTYKLYSTNGTSGTGISTGFGAYSPTLLSTGYYHNATDFHNFVTQKISDNYGIELTGKLRVTTASATYQFRSNLSDDQFALIIDGNVVINQTAFGTTTSANVNLTAGYHDIIIRGRELGGGQKFDLQWNSGSGGAFTAIADDNFYTQVQGVSAWYTADNILSSNPDGTALNSASNNVWSDLSSNGNDVTTSGTDNPTYYATTASKIRNFNPVIEFTNDRLRDDNYLQGFAYGKQGKSLFGVSDMFASGGPENLSGYGRDATNDQNFLILKTAANVPALQGWGTDLLGPGGFYTAARRTDILSGTYANGSITAINNAGLYANNGLLTQGARLTWNTIMNDNSQLDVGNFPDRAVSEGWDGKISEILYYPWTLSTVERQKVNSYLAAKWGITLDQATATNYIASDGTVMWNAAAGGTYKNDITVIGRDDCGALNQKQSTSTDESDIVAMGLGTSGIAVNNMQNSNLFANDKSFMTWANNNATNSFTNFNTTTLPASLLGTCYVKMNRVWQVQSVNNPGTVSMTAGKKGVFVFNAATVRPVLLISNSDTDFSAATVVQPTKVSQGIAYFDNLTFTNGQYFTYAFVQGTPGGVGSNLKVWFNSGYDAFTDIGQTTYAENNGDVVRSLNNLVVGANFASIDEVSNTYNPTYKPGSFNYNAGILFDGTDDVLATTGNINTTDYRSTNQMTSILAGSLVTGTSGNVFWFHDNGGAGTIKTALERDKGYWSSNTTVQLTRVPTLTDPELYTFTNNIAGTYKLYSNLKTVGSGTATDISNVSGRFRVGNNVLGAGGSPANFYLGEFVIYSDDKNISDLRKIHSYLAIKYGFTLDAAAMGGQYIASDGTTATYNHAGYWNRITGIGRDDCSSIEQKQSFSQELIGSLVKISNDINGLAVTNEQNPATFQVNKSFLVFGDNNKSLTWTGVDNITDPTTGNNLVRLNRVWRVKETGTVGEVYLQVPDNTSSLTTKLPSTPAPVYLIVANTAGGGNFKGAITIKEMIPNGTDWSVTYDFADGDYYTFATGDMCLAPAGITDGLMSWYKITDLPTGAIAASTANAVVDNYGTNSLNRNASGTATVTAGTPIFYNYNRYMSLTGNAAFTKSNVSETALTGASNGALYAVGSGSGNLFGTSLNTTEKFFINNAAVYRNATGSALSGAANGNIYQMGVNNGVITSRSNGATVAGATGTTPLLAGSTYTIGLGTYAAGSGFNNTNLAEAFSFNRDLTASEKDILDSYLAIKYGQTLTHNYYAPDYNGTNAATTTLYDVSNYNNRIFGVGNHRGGCFYQNQSSSNAQSASLSNSMLKISVDGVLNAENSQDPLVWLEDQSYIVMGDDNGAIAWVNTNKPKIEANNSCLYRITRQWKVVSTKRNPNLLVTIADNANTNHAAGAKLDVVPANNDVYMVISDQSDFTSATAAQQIVKMTLNNTTKEWEANVSFDPDSTRYITFVYKPLTCGLPCVPVNPATSRSRIK